MLLGGYAVARVTDPERWDLLDDVDLAIHEAGHVLFAPFGDSMHFLGGSLFQLLVPMTFVAYFARNRQRYSAAVVASWLGVSTLNVARYVADAREQALPLLGGENSIHDWWYLLTEWDLLPHDLAIARAIRAAAVLCFVVSVGGGLAFLREGETAYPSPLETGSA